jgi:4-hydroxythreonine-4-phosphate dehydrogenase
MACELARNRSVVGIVTAPISKKSLNLGDFHYPGHTEMLAQYLNSPDCQMMMVYKDLRVVPMTRHVPIRDVASRISEDLLLTCLRETHRGLLEWFGIEAPRIAVAGLNPHAGEGGVIGTEERDVIAPVLDRLRDVGMDVTGPLPADSMFQSAGRLLEETLAESSPRGDDAPDAYVTMYHDQGLVPFKMVARRRGVNVTVGLPVIRTSVDHGCAYDIAGQGIAETASLREAYELAESLAHNRVEK